MPIRGRMAKRLTREEIDKALRKLERKYDEYIIEYGKTPVVKESFRSRYIDVLNRRMDVETFIFAEMEALDERMRAERLKIAELRDRAAERRRKAVQPSGGDFADRVLAGYAEKISGYPLLPAAGPDLPEEISRLYGAIREISHTGWPEADHLLRDSYPPEVGWSRGDLENAMLALCAPSAEVLPLPLDRYARALRNRNVPIQEPDRLRKQAILDASFFLHRLHATLYAFIKRTAADQSEIAKTVQEILASIAALIADFRLSDLRPPGIPGP